MLFPTKFRSGDTIEWTLNATTDTYGNPISSPDWSVIYYLRTNKSIRDRDWETARFLPV